MIYDIFSWRKKNHLLVIFLAVKFTELMSIKSLLLQEAKEIICIAGVGLGGGVVWG